MKNINRIYFLVLCFLVIIMIVPAVSADNCVCLDANGSKYGNSAPGSSLCYSCGEDGCTPNGYTLAQCQPPAPTQVPVVEQPVIQQPVVQPIVQPVIEQPVVQQPVIEQPTAQPIVQPVIEQPVVQQPNTGGTGTDPYGQDNGYGTGTDPYGQDNGYGNDTDPYGQDNGYGNGTDPYGQDNGYGTGTDPYGQDNGYGNDTDPYGQDNGYGNDTDPYGQDNGYGNDTDPYGQDNGYGDDTDPYGQDNGYGNDSDLYGLGAVFGQDTDTDGEGTDTEGQGTGMDGEGTDTEGQGTGTDGQGTGTDGQGTGTDGEGTDTEGQGTGTEGQGTGTDGEGTDTDGEGTDTEGQGTGTDGEGTDTEGQCTGTDGEGTDTEGQGTGTDGEGTDTEGQGTGTDGEGTDTEGQGTGTDGEGTDTEGQGSEEQIESPLSKKAREELAELLSEDDLANLHLWITAEWLDSVRELLSEETLNELQALLPAEKDEEEPIMMLKSASVPIEGELTEILLSTPNGGTINTGNVPFVWIYDYADGTGETDVTFYLELTIVHGSDTATLSTTLSSASCANRICSTTMDLSAYDKSKITWTVSGSYESGGSTVTVSASSSQSFNLDISQPTPTPTPGPTPKPKAPVQECPKGHYDTRNIGFFWAPSKYAESYTVEWHDNKGHHGTLTLSNSDPTCQGGRCIIYTTLPADGAYGWTVTAKNSAGSAKSGEMKFDVGSYLPTPSPYRPHGTVGAGYAAFEWQDVQHGVNSYQVQVVGSNNKTYLDRWFNVNDIYVGHGVCFVQTNVYLGPGSYSWRVRATNGSTTTGWSGWMDFKVYSSGGGGSIPNNNVNTVPTPTYPVGTINNNTPNFQWRAVTGAAYYTVKLIDSSGVVQFDRQVYSAGNCTGQVCTWTPGFKLPKNGNYTWIVSAYGGNGLLWNNATGTFVLQGAAPNPMSFISPAQNGLITPDSQKIIWTDPGANTTRFHVEIFNKAGTMLFQTDLSREQAWCDGQRCTLEFKSIPDAADYRITVTPYSNMNTAGTPISLVFSKGSRLLKLNSPKEGSVVQSRPLFRWAQEANANTLFDLIVTDSMNNVTAYNSLTCNVEGVTCEGGEVFFTPAKPLPAGAYTARLALSGGGGVSNDLHFTVR